jgi:hypothetical protein
MDMPVAIVEWEVFAPERYSIKSIGGNAIETSLMRRMSVADTLPAFSTARHDFIFDRRPRELIIELSVGGVTETVTVSAERPLVDTQNAARRTIIGNDFNEPRRQRPDPAPIVAPSQKVVELQRRTTGVLPVRIDIPRAGTSHQFVKPLVVDQETTIRLRYKRR